MHKSIEKSYMKKSQSLLDKTHSQYQNTNSSRMSQLHIMYSNISASLYEFSLAKLALNKLECTDCNHLKILYAQI